MARSQHRSRRKVSGGLYHYSRGKNKSELAGFPALTRVDETIKKRVRRTPGGNHKTALLTVKTVNVADKKGKVTNTDIIKVVESPANANLVRRNIITKGSVVETKLGKVKITSRPGQEGSVNGLLL